MSAPEGLKFQKGDIVGVLITPGEVWVTGTVKTGPPNLVLQAVRYYSAVDWSSVTSLSGDKDVKLESKTILSIIPLEKDPSFEMRAPDIVSAGFTGWIATDLPFPYTWPVHMIAGLKPKPAPPKSAAPATPAAPKYLYGWPFLVPTPKEDAPAVAPPAPPLITNAESLEYQLRDLTAAVKDLNGTSQLLLQSEIRRLQRELDVELKKNAK